MKRLKHWLWDRMFIPYGLYVVDGAAAMLIPLKGVTIITVPSFMIKGLKQGEKVWLDRRGNLRREYDDPKGIRQAEVLRRWAQAVTGTGTETMEARR